jgi:hypothetical protein
VIAVSQTACVNKKPNVTSAANSIPISIDYSRQRPNLDQWKVWMADYSLRHYGENEWKLNPKAIILHYTATSVFPNSFINSDDSFKNEMPPLATQYVVQGAKIFEVLPATVRCRGALGANQRAISIEMVAMDENEVLNNQVLISATARLTAKLMLDYSISISEVYSHEDIDSSIESKKIGWVLDKVNARGSGKEDPGTRAMTKIIAATRAILESEQSEPLSLASAADIALSKEELDKQFPVGNVTTSGE